MIKFAIDRTIKVNIRVPSKIQQCLIKMITYIPQPNDLKIFYCYILFQNLTLPTKFSFDPIYRFSSIIQRNLNISVFNNLPTDPQFT